MSKDGAISGAYFPVFGLNTEKSRPEITPQLGKNLRVNYFNDLKSKNCEDKEKFWTTVKFTFSNKNKAANVVTPMERIDQYEGSFPNCNMLIALGSTLVLLALLTS